MRYHKKDFIQDDPIQIPHEYALRQDIEITAFWTAILSWGQRKTIIRKSKELFAMMDHAPYEFVMQHKEEDLKPFAGFKHRTFQPTDTLYFIHFLRQFYQKHDSLEEAFTAHCPKGDSVRDMLVGFHDLFFDDSLAPKRSRKHIATPARKSTCKRLNMFLRWMVRKDEQGVDFGLWEKIPASALLMPLDVHVRRVAQALNLLHRKQNDFQAVEELTAQMRLLDPEDPVKYDFALFGLGLNGGVDGLVH